MFTKKLILNGSGYSLVNWISQRKSGVVPYECIVGCNTCSNLCMGNAIPFQHVQKIRELYKREETWSKVREILKQEGELAIRK